VNINDFVQKRPFLYHLTDHRNYEIIKESRVIYSTRDLVYMSEIDDKESFLRSRRPYHTQIQVEDNTIYIRDQRPISEKALSKCLTNGWKCVDYIYHLNRRVFFWPTKERLIRHFNRYKGENPIIIRVSTKDLFGLNPHSEFCRLNSGATRPNSYLGGIPPLRGLETFRQAEDYGFTVSSVAEVTFQNNCTIPDQISISNNPLENWTDVTFD